MQKREGIMRKLFLLEDDLSMVSGLTFAFKKQGFALDTARTLAEAEALWSDRKYDLLVLDVSLILREPCMLLWKKHVLT